MWSVFSFFRSSAVMLKKAQSLVMLAALILLGALLFSFGNGLVQSASYVAGDTAGAAKHGSLPKLAESTVSNLPDRAASRTDNSTLPVTSGGAVEASFTVISRPSSDRGESVTPSAADGGTGSAGAPVATPAREETTVPGDQTMRDGHLGTAAGVGPKSGGLTPGWALLMGAWAVGDVALGVFAFRYGRAGRRSLRLEDRGDSSRQLPV
jgi:hypothetical protein